MPVPKKLGKPGAHLSKIAEQRQDHNDAYVKVRELGRGSFGTVWEALNQRTGQMVAIKEIRLGRDHAKNQQLVDQAFVEFDLQRHLRHPNVVSVYDSCLMGGGGENGTEQTYAIIMELISGRSIFDLIKLVGAFHESIVRRYTKQLLTGLAYCHKKRCVHRDIKGQNIMLTINGEVRLADFGSAAFRGHEAPADAEADKLQGHFSYTPLFVAPEAIVSAQGTGGPDSTYDEKVDIWALGCTVVQMASGKEPWDEMNFQNLAQCIFHISSRDVHPLIPETLSREAVDFCKRCFIRDPAKRPSAAELLKHPFIVGDGDSPTGHATSVGAEGRSLSSPIGSHSAEEQLQTLNDLVTSQCQTMRMTEDRPASSLQQPIYNVPRQGAPGGPAIGRGASSGSSAGAPSPFTTPGAAHAMAPMLGDSVSSNSSYGASSGPGVRRVHSNAVLQHPQWGSRNSDSLGFDVHYEQRDGDEDSMNSSMSTLQLAPRVGVSLDAECRALMARVHAANAHRPS